MRSAMRGTSTALFAALLAGCPSQSVVLPSGEGLSDHEAAILKIDRTVKTGGLRPELNAVVDLNAGTILLKSEPFKNYYRIKVAPGHYNVQLKVYSYGHQPAFPRARVQAKAGMTYLFTSSIILDGKAVRAEFKEIPTASDTTPNE